MKVRPMRVNSEKKKDIAKARLPKDWLPRNIFPETTNLLTSQKAFAIII